MTDTTTVGVQRYLGGESGHRSFFGGTHPRIRILLLSVFGVLMLVLTPIVGVWGLAIAVIGGGLTLLLTARTHRGTLLERHTKRARWANRVRRGTDVFVPYDVARWDQLEQAVTDAHGRHEPWKARRALAGMRGNPDGADGMGWLQHGRGEPGIAWHAPTGEPSYLSVTFAVTGQLRGIESGSAMRRAADGWGSFLAAHAGPTSLVRDVQTLTRVLPADTALQEFWVLGGLDRTAPPDAMRSYEDVLRLTGEDAMVQRHYLTLRWPLTPAFHDAALRHTPGRDGWRALMVQEITTAKRGLIEARLGEVEVLTARQVAAVILHQQNPSRPIDYVADTHPTHIGLPSHDEFSAHIVDDSDPVTGLPVQWWHRTAAIRGDALATGPRSQLWMLDLLIGTDLEFVRSISFHLHLVPAAEAKNAARRDLTRDTAATIADVEAGRLTNDETDTNMTAARRRTADLSAGSHHHGATWVGYVTISERGRSGLMRASRRLEDTCHTGLGIERVEWLDSYQAAASGTTWPLARGHTTTSTPMSTRFYNRLAGRSEKDALT